MSAPGHGPFDGVARLHGAAALARLRAAHVAVIGLGGVGSWTAEALARSGVGRLTLVDLDDICLTNVNRQLHALPATVGRPKVVVMAERLRAIRPDAAVTPVAEFLTAASADRLLAPGFDLVVDAVDAAPAKALLAARCRARGVPLVMSGAAGGRRDPTRLRIADLADTTHDPLLAEVRRVLRREHGFPAAGAAFGVRAVHSLERPVYPQPDGSVCAARPPGETGATGRLSCDAGLGTAAHVTGAFGLAAAAEAVRLLAEDSAGHGGTDR